MLEGDTATPDNTLGWEPSRWAVCSCSAHDTALAAITPRATHLRSTVAVPHLLMLSTRDAIPFTAGLPLSIHAGVVRPAKKATAAGEDRGKVCLLLTSASSAGPRADSSRHCRVSLDKASV